MIMISLILISLGVLFLFIIASLIFVLRAISTILKAMLPGPGQRPKEEE